MAALRKELQEAQQQAAQEAGHVAQFKSLAEGAEETTSIVQVQTAMMSHHTWTCTAASGHLFGLQNVCCRLDSMTWVDVYAT